MSDSHSQSEKTLQKHDRGQSTSPQTSVHREVVSSSVGTARLPESEARVAAAVKGLTFPLHDKIAVANALAEALELNENQHNVFVAYITE